MVEHTLITTSVGALATKVTGTGPPAVVWPSLFVDDRSWDRLVPSLSATRRLVIINGPGHGGSGDLGRRYTIRDCADSARTVIEHLGVDRPIYWVGNAWGGHVGADFAASYPKLCRSLVMLGTPVEPLSVVERARTYLLLGAYRLTGPSSLVLDAVTETLLSGHTRSRDPQAVELVRDCLRRADRRMLRNAVVSVSLRRVAATETLRLVTQPALILTGAHHHGFTPQQAREAAALMRQGKTAVVPDSAYLVPLEAPDTCARLITEFWAAQSGVSECRN